jgi:uncharacterized membrane protein YczE
MIKRGFKEFKKKQPTIILAILIMIIMALLIFIFPKIVGFIKYQLFFRWICFYWKQVDWKNK